MRGVFSKASRRSSSTPASRSSTTLGWSPAFRARIHTRTRCRAASASSVAACESFDGGALDVAGGPACGTAAGAVPLAVGAPLLPSELLTGCGATCSCLLAMQPIVQLLWHDERTPANVKHELGEGQSATTMSIKSGAALSALASRLSSHQLLDAARCGRLERRHGTAGRVHPRLARRALLGARRLTLGVARLGREPQRNVDLGFGDAHAPEEAEAAQQGGARLGRRQLHRPLQLLGRARRERRRAGERRRRCGEAEVSGVGAISGRGGAAQPVAHTIVEAQLAARSDGGGGEEVDALLLDLGVDRHPRNERPSPGLSRPRRSLPLGPEPPFGP
eukprot:scaffold75668_cov75-Phaeocystis_antarctica.AAC.2